MSYHNPSTFNKSVIAKGDSAASGHYWQQEDVDCLTRLTNSPGPSVTLPNNTFIQADQQGTLPLSKTLSTNARSVVVLPSLKSSSLISLGQLCDNDCRVLLDKRKLYVIKEKNMVLQGDRNRTDGLWDIKIPYYDVYKKNLQSDNFHQPPTHAVVYSTSTFTTTLLPAKILH